MVQRAVRRNLLPLFSVSSLLAGEILNRYAWPFSCVIKFSFPSVPHSNRIASDSSRDAGSGLLIE